MVWCCEPGQIPPKILGNAPRRVPKHISACKLTESCYTKIGLVLIVRVRGKGFSQKFRVSGLVCYQFTLELFLTIFQFRLVPMHMGHYA